MTTVTASTNYQRLIRAELQRRCDHNPRYSLRAFARALGFEPTVISQIISGKRVPTLKTATKLVEALSFPPRERDLFMMSLAETHRDRGVSKLAPFREFLSPRAPQDLELERFKAVADWHHYAILALTQTAGFQSRRRWIASQLGISNAECNLAIDRLLQLGLLRLDGGRWESVHQDLTTADKHVTSAALKTHQKQVLQRSITSLENDPIESRKHSSMTMAIDPRRLPAAQQMIEDFIQSLSAFLETGAKERVYELTLSLYPVQKKGN